MLAVAGAFKPCGSFGSAVAHVACAVKGCLPVVPRVSSATGQLLTDCRMDPTSRFSNLVLVLSVFAAIVKTDFTDPKFGEPITNVTVPVGREGVMACLVEDLANYKVAWLRVDTQTILTIANHVITKNHRIDVKNSDHRWWYLHIKDVREKDRGWYMCQINTDPMKSQIGFLQVVVPPDILDSPTSTDIIAREGSNVSLLCAAKGTPEPNITWKRENGEHIHYGHPGKALYVEGPSLNISRISRLHMGAYLCIASNGVPPSVSKRIQVTVHFPPMIHIPNQLVGAYLGEQVTLECSSEAYPKSINYWMKDLTGMVGPNGNKYETHLVDNAYKVNMKLTIKSVSKADYGSYKCVSKNSLGDTDGTIKLYRISKEMSQRMRDGAGKYGANEIMDMSSREADFYVDGEENVVDSPEAEGSTSSSSQGSILFSFVTTVSSAVFLLTAS